MKKIIIISNLDPVPIPHHWSRPHPVTNSPRLQESRPCPCVCVYGFLHQFHKFMLLVVSFDLSHICSLDWFLIKKKFTWCKDCIKKKKKKKINWFHYLLLHWTDNRMSATTWEEHIWCFQRYQSSIIHHSRATLAIFLNQNCFIFYVRWTDIKYYSCQQWSKSLTLNTWSDDSYIIYHSYNEFWWRWECFINPIKSKLYMDN